MVSPRAEADICRMTAAFPGKLRQDVLDVIDAMPGNPELMLRTGELTSEWSTDSHAHPVGLSVDGERITLPGRIHHGIVEPELALAAMGQRRQLIMGCLYTRHHDGYERQKWLGEILPATDQWVAPFVVQLVGEYVVEIVADIERGLRDVEQPGARRTQYGQFVAENPGYLGITHQRAASYWNEYHRYRFPRFDTYPASIALRRLASISLPRVG